MLVAPISQFHSFAVRYETWSFQGFLVESQTSQEKTADTKGLAVECGSCGTARSQVNDESRHERVLTAVLTRTFFRFG